MLALPALAYRMTRHTLTTATQVAEVHVDAVTTASPASCHPEVHPIPPPLPPVPPPAPVSSAAPIVFAGLRPSISREEASSPVGSTSGQRTYVFSSQSRTPRSDAQPCFPSGARTLPLPAPGGRYPFQIPQLLRVPWTSNPPTRRAKCWRPRNLAVCKSPPPCSLEHGAPSPRRPGRLFSCTRSPFRVMSRGSRRHARCSTRPTSSRSSVP